MSTNKHQALHFFILTSIACLCTFVSGCSKSKNALVEAPATYQPSPVAPQIKMPNLVPPKLPEVQDAVHRVFKDAAVVDSSANPGFFTGDFNGDGSGDLAVVLKPAPNKIADMNEPYPAWLLRDPFSTERATLNVELGDVLLAIIHGYGDNDWRDSQATQTFLLKNVVGSNISVKTAQEFMKANSGKRLPRPQGDLIGQTLRGNNGYLYYASANYSWYDPKKFKSSKIDVGMVHGGR
jgi:hypothetical protein